MALWLVVVPSPSICELTRCDIQLYNRKVFLILGLESYNMSILDAAVVLIGRSPRPAAIPEPLPLVLLATVFLLTSWVVRRVGAKGQPRESVRER